jgi:hypothetical protein
MMQSCAGRTATACLFAMYLLPGLVHAQVSVTTYHNDNARTGQNTQETILTPANVNNQSFGKLFSVALDGYVYAQPLYLPGVTIDGGAHDVVYMATEHDSVYAIDADSGTVYSHTSLIPSGGSTVSSSADLGCTDLIPEVGITGTPVIDPTTKTLYVVAKAKTSAGTIVQYLHALDVTTLAEKFGGPKLVTASAPGTASEGNGTTVPFNPKVQLQRPALLLENGHVIIGWSGHCDAYPWHGWVMSYSASTLTQEAVLNVTPDGAGGAVWMSGGGIAADSSGDIYFPTGNGTWNGTTDFADSIVKLGLPSGGKFPLLDYFTPWNQASLESNDTDVSAGGLVLLPALSSGLQLLAQQGKFGTLVLLNRSNLGKYCRNQTPACSGSDPNAVQEITNAGGGVWGSPAYWNGNLYVAPSGSSIRAYSFDAGGSGKLSTSPTSQSAQTFAYAAPTPAISANGTTDGILWALDGSGYNSTCGTAGVNCLGLFAYDATNLSTLLYSSSKSANDSPGATVKYAVPVIANGKVYVGAQSGLSAYGLLPHAATLAAPTFSPAAGSYTTAQTVTLSAATGATIYYTTNGSTPTTGSPKYSAPLSISATTTIKAIAVASGYTNSAVASATYTINLAGGGGGGGGGGSSGTPVSVNLSGVDNLYGIVNEGTAVSGAGLNGYAFAYAANLLGTSAAWNGATFTFGAAGSPNATSSKTIALPAGNYTSLSLLGAGANGNQLNQSFVVSYSDGTSSTFTQSLSSWLSPQGYAGESTVSTMAYRVSPTGATSAGPVYLYGYRFALNNAKSVASITLPNNANVFVLAVSLQPASAATPTAASPTFSPAGGNYGATQTVSLADSTPGASIYYTTNGSTPTTGSSKYSTPISVSATTTIRAIAVASGYNTSAVASATYTISAPAPVSVSLNGAANVYAIVNIGSAVPGTGVDLHEYAYPAQQLGSQVSWAGSTFTFGTPGTLNGIESKTLALPSGNYSALNMLATAVNGDKLNMPFTVTYSDGTTTTFYQSLSDWCNPVSSYAGQTSVVTTSVRVTPTGGEQTASCHVYAYSFALNSAKKPVSLTLPPSYVNNVVVLAVDLAPP